MQFSDSKTAPDGVTSSNLMNQPCTHCGRTCFCHSNEVSCSTSISTSSCSSHSGYDSYDNSTTSSSDSSSTSDSDSSTSTLASSSDSIEY